MGYYRGDYYRGDGGNYYRGDPFLGAVVGSLVGRAAGRIGGFVGRRVAGAARRAVPILREAVPSTIAGAAGYAAGQRAGTMTAESLLGPLDVGPGGRTSTKRERAVRKILGVGGERSPRRMNPLNPKALRRALRRAEGFEKFAKRTVNALYKTVDGRRVRSFKKRKSR